jgi:hypothetical protein
MNADIAAADFVATDAVNTYDAGSAPPTAFL